MSIFSSFDAVCAESVGRKAGFSWAPAPSMTSNKQDAAVADAKIGDLKKDKEVNSSSPPTKVPVRMRTPRFAPELDGVHCFETILPF